MNSERGAERRLRAFTRLGWTLLGGMAICIPLCAAIGGVAGGPFAIVPLVLLMLWATVVGRAIWRSTDLVSPPAPPVPTAREEELEAKIQEMENRLNSVETISSYEMRAAASESGDPEASETLSSTSREVSESA